MGSMKLFGGASASNPRHYFGSVFSGFNSVPNRFPATAKLGTWTAFSPKLRDQNLTKTKPQVLVQFQTVFAGFET
jgi:hypothetical protein